MSDIAQPHFIALLTPNPGGNSPKQVKEEYNYTIEKELYNKYNSSQQRLSYELLDKHLNNVCNEKVIIVSEDRFIPSLTINTYSKFHNVASIYISNSPKIITNTHEGNILYFGVDKDILTENARFKLEENLITHFTFKKIKQMGMQKICKIINNMYCGKKLHVILDLQIVDQTISPSVKRESSQKDFISMENINEIIHEFKNIWYLDIIGFDESLDDAMFRYTKITGETCRTIIKNIFNIKEKSMNIFTEDSRFLIYRPVEQISNDDIGWYIVRFMTLKEREIFLHELIDKVITINIDNPYPQKDLEVYITSTSMQEQNLKSFYTAKSIQNYCLFPDEKISMIFELLNTKSAENDSKQ